MDSLFVDEKNQETDEGGNVLHYFERYNIMECNKEGSKDYIIGPPDIKMDGNACSNNEESPIE